MLLDVTIQPVMFVLLFAFVFGSSIDVDTQAGYRAWLLPGIMAQTVAFASFIVAVGLTADLEKGIVDRMRSLPINPAAVLVGRSISSLVHSSIGLVVMSLTGLVIGWRIHTSVPEAVLGYLLLLGWGFAMIWVGIWVGSAMRSVEAVNGRHVRHDVPDHVPGQHLRADRPDADRAALHRRVEPDLVADPGRPRALGQRPAARAGRSLPDAPPDPVHDRVDHR